MKPRYLAVLSLAALSAAANAQVYKCVSAGKTIYSDHPCAGESVKRIEGIAPALTPAQVAAARAQAKADEQRWAVKQHARAVEEQQWRERMAVAEQQRAQAAAAQARAQADAADVARIERAIRDNTRAVEDAATMSTAAAAAASSSAAPRTMFCSRGYCW